MSTNYYANTIIGYKLPPDGGDPFLIEVEGKPEKAFDHTYVYSDNVQFCPKTGKQLWVKESEWKCLDGYDEGDSFKTYSLLYQEDENAVYVGIGSVHVGGYGAPSHKASTDRFLNFDVEEFKQDLQPVFDNNGWEWEDSRFGLWTILTWG